MAEQTKSELIILSNVMNDIRVWHFSLEFNNNELIKIHSTDDPFIGNANQKDHYCEMISEMAEKRHIPIKKIHVFDCGRARSGQSVTKDFKALVS